MNKVAITSAIRTPVGGFGGSLRSVSADALAVQAIQALVNRSGIDVSAIDEVVIAQSYASSEAPCLGRYAALGAGLPIEIPGYTVDRRCGSGLQAVINGALAIQAGQADVVLVVGVESMSNIEFYTTDMRWGRRSGSVVMHDRLQRGRERSQPADRFGTISGMPETVENLVREFSISRESADRFAALSHEKAAAAWDAGRFEDEVFPVQVKQRSGETVLFERDEGIRRDVNLAALAGLKAIIPGGTVTAGNACQQNDAAAACLLVSEPKLRELGLEPLAYLHGWAAVGCHPATMGIGPVPAVEKVMSLTGLSLKDMDLVEINEAFAAQVLAVLQGWGWNDPTKLNVNGGGIALGHPIGATGVRMLATLLHELKRRNGRYGLETMCIGGGQGMAAIFRRD